MRKANHKTVIMSAYKKDYKEKSNIARHIALRDDLQEDFALKEVVGKYDDEYEQSLVIPVKSNREIRLLSAIANHYEQDCILVINEDNTVNLLHSDGITEKTGTFKEISAARAINSGAFTYDPSTEIYYKVV